MKSTGIDSQQRGITIKLYQQQSHNEQCLMVQMVFLLLYGNWTQILFAMLSLAMFSDNLMMQEKRFLDK